MYMLEIGTVDEEIAEICKASVYRVAKESAEIQNNWVTFICLKTENSTKKSHIVFQLFML